MPHLFFALAPALLLAAPAAAKPTVPHIMAAEVVLGTKDARAAVMAETLQHATLDEAAYYDPAGTPSVMRITVEKIGFKSTGKAAAAMLPVVGMFAGPNRNLLRGHVELLDQASGRCIKRFKIECDDDMQFSAADGMIAFAKFGLGFLPVGDLVASVADIGQAAAEKRSAAEAMLTRGFVMLSYKKLYGAKLYKRFADQRKAALTRAATPAAAIVPAATSAPRT